MKNTGGAPEATVGQLVKAANSNARILLEYLSQHPQVSERMLEEALVKALEEENTQAVVNLLQHGVDPNGCHLPESSTLPLFYAAATPSPSRGLLYTELLIHAKVDVNIDGFVKELFEEDCHYPVINKLINAGFDLTQHGPIAIERGILHTDPDVVVLLIDRGTSVNSYGERVTPFQAAAFFGPLELLQYLLTKGAEVNKPAFPARVYTALQAAAHACSVETIQFLLSVGADINAPPAVTGGVTALEGTVRPMDLLSYDDIDKFKQLYEAEEEPSETFIFLLSEGAAVNRPDGSSSPLLHDIIERRNTRLL